jgi:hypothetical protein
MARLLCHALSLADWQAHPVGLAFFSDGARIFHRRYG